MNMCAHLRIVANVSKPSAKRPAQPVGRYGLVHIAGVKVGSPLPQPLQQLEYRAMVVEAGLVEFASGVHNLVPKLLLKGVPLLVGGERTNVNEFLTYVREAIHGEQIHDTEIMLCVPAAEPVYRFRALTLRIVTRLPLMYKVCLHARF